jgi:hypothetical protein
MDPQEPAFDEPNGQSRQPRSLNVRLAPPDNPAGAGDVRPASGYHADHYKLVVFILSASLSGLAGSLKSLVFQLASLTDVEWTMSGWVVLMTLVGGLGTVLGPVVGAFFLVAMQHYLAQLGSWVTVVQGVIFVVCVLVFRRGIVGTIAFYAAPPRAAPGGEKLTEVGGAAAARGTS